MSKVTNKRKHLIRGLLTVSEAIMAIMAGGTVAKSHGDGAVAESLYPDPQARGGGWVGVEGTRLPVDF